MAANHDFEPLSERLAVPSEYVEEVRRHLHVRATMAIGRRRTRVTLDRCTLPRPGSSGPAWLMLTTELRARLSTALFDRDLAVRVNGASREKGRVVFAVDLNLNEVIGAAAYHVPERSSSPLLITALAPRVDQVAALGRASIPILKATIHQIARFLDRPGHVELWANGRSAIEACELYGFRPGRRAPGRASGSAFLVQDEPSLGLPPAPEPGRRRARRG